MGPVSIFEVGPRDGLQNEKRILPTTDKIWLLEGLERAGILKIEAGSFVRPDRVPQMADSEEVLRELNSRNLSGDYYFLVPNRKGLERALRSGAKKIAVFTAASESFNLKNIGMGVSESLTEIQSTVEEAVESGLGVRAYVSTAFGCPFEGRVDPARVRQVLDRLLSFSVEQVSIGDTIGVAVPASVQALLRPILGNGSDHRIAVHFHDTRGTALANACEALRLGVRTFDSSLGGLGGCPFAPGASGNLATEDLAYLFKESGVDAGVDYRALCDLSLELGVRMGKSTPASRALQAYSVNCTRDSTWDS